MNIQPMTVAELIEHLRTLPEERQIFLHDREALTKEDIIIRNYDRHGIPRVIIGRVYNGDRCSCADNCIHFQAEV